MAEGTDNIEDHVCVCVCVCVCLCVCVSVCVCSGCALTVMCVWCVTCTVR